MKNHLLLGSLVAVSLFACGTDPELISTTDSTTDELTTLADGGVGPARSKDGGCGPGGGRNGEFRLPPQIAFDACIGKVADDACTVTTPNGDKTGTCKGGPNGGALACIPEGGPGGGGHGGKGPHGPPPAESLAACVGLTDGTACGFTHDGNNLTGTCRTGPNGEAIACLPARPAAP